MDYVDSRPVRENAGADVERLEPNFTGKAYDSVNKRVQFLMHDPKSELKPYDMEISM